MDSPCISDLTAIVKKTMTDHKMIFDKARIVIGLSGGPDSVCLFDILCNLSDEYHLDLYPVHVNHCIRAEAADRDQSYAEALAESRGLICRSFKENCPDFAKKNQLSTEEAGRIIRYRIFSEVADEILEETGESGQNESDKTIPPVLIALGQHADDRAETVLFRIIKGTGTDGLVGIEYTRKAGENKKIIRPLLDIYKEDIINYCRDRSLKPHEDLTNQDRLYERNAIRLDLIPRLEAGYNKRIKEALNRLADTAAEDRAYMEREACKAYETCLLAIEEADKRIVLDGGSLKKIPYPVSRRVLRMAFADIGLKQDIRYSHYEACRNIIENGDPSARTNLPHGYFLMNCYDRVVLGKESNKASATEKMNGGSEEGYRVFGDFEYRKVYADEDNKIGFTGKDSGRSASSVIICLDREKIEKDLGEGAAEKLEIRSRLPGDRIRLPGGSRKLKKFFIDKKIPKDCRDKVMVVAIENHVAAIAYLNWLIGGEDRRIHVAVNESWENKKVTRSGICIELRPRI
jgi:tRNA(Ile)-lysidine synthase